MDRRSPFVGNSKKGKRNKSRRFEFENSRNRRLRFESLESRRVLATVISEIHVEPLFGSNERDQFVEFRGTPNSTVQDGTYFVVVEGWGAVPGGTGYVHSSINLSGLKFGSNGFLVIAQAGNPTQIDAAATSVIATGPGFAGLPGNRWSDASTNSDRFAFIFNSGTFMLIEAPTAPVPASDADANDDGTLDGAAANWKIIDSVGLLNTTASLSRSYGKITFSEEPNYLFPAGTVLIDTDGEGYVGRIGASTGWGASDWVSGTTIDGDSSSAINYRFTFGTFGDPRPLVYSGRSIDHLGTYNFDGGVQGTVAKDSNLDGQITSADTLMPNVRILADQNQNGVQDNFLTTVIANDYAEGTELTNRFPNATLTIADANNKNIGFVVRTKKVNTDNVFSSEGIPWFDASGRLKVMFYKEANAVSVLAIGAETLRDSYGRMEVYDRNDQLLGSVQTGPMRSPQRTMLDIVRATADIKYAIIYTNNNFANSSPFGPFDRLSYTYPEFEGITDAQGRFAIEELPKGNYSIRTSGAPVGIPLASIPTNYPLSVTKTEHLLSADFGFRDNLPPTFTTTAFDVPENSAVGTFVGQIDGGDPDNRQTVSYEFLGNAGPFAIDSITGSITVLSSTNLDFETTLPLVVQVRVSDSFSPPASITKNVTLSLTDVNEPPVIAAGTFSIQENSPNGALIGSVVATDPDAGSNGVIRFSISSGGPTSVFLVDPINGSLTVRASSSLDFETKSTWDIPITVTDQGTPALSSQRTVTVNLTDVNEAPSSIRFSNVVSVAESVSNSVTTTVATIQIVDDKLGTNVLTLSGPDSDSFSIVSGQLRFKSTTRLDFETKPTFSVTVNVDDPSVGLTPDVSVPFVLQITDVNEPPTGLLFSNLVQNIPESTNTATALRIASLQVVDDALGSNALSLSGTDANRFFILNRELFLKANTLLDFETQNTYRINVNVDDNTVGLSPDVLVPLTINVTDVNEPPTAVFLDPITSSVFESTEPSAGFVVANFEVIDDALGTNTFSLIGADASTFEVVGNQLRVRSGMVFDFESKSTYEVTIRAEDASLPGSTFPEVIGGINVQNRTEVASITDRNSQLLGPSSKSIRLHFDSIAILATGAITLQKTDVAGAIVPTTTTTSVINGRTVADLGFSGPFSNGDWLTDGKYIVTVDGEKVTESGSLEKGLSFVSTSYLFLGPALPGNLELTGPQTVLKGKDFSVIAKLSVPNTPISGNVDFQIDFDGDGVVDRTESGPLTTTLTKLKYASAGSYTFVVTATQNSVVLAKSNIVIDVSPATTALENWLSALDTDRDTTISPLDVLIVINNINSRPSGLPVQYFLNQDVDRDGTISPLDVLFIINALNIGSSNAVQTFDSLTIAQSGAVNGLTSDASIAGKILTESRALFVSLDGPGKKDASSFVKADGTFAITDAAIVQLFGAIPDGEHTISVTTRTNNQYSTAMDRRFKRVTTPPNDFAILSVLDVEGATRVRWSNSTSGSRYKVYASANGGPPTILASSIANNEARLNLPTGNYSLFIEAMDGAGNTKRSAAVSVVI